MPSVPSKRICNFLGCKETPLYNQGSCALHGGKVSEKRVANSKLYNSSAWKQKREVMRSKYPLCAACLLEGKVTATAHIDHVIPHRREQDKFHVNLFQGLCAPHHTLKTILEKTGIYRCYAPSGIVDYKDGDYNNVVTEKFHSDYL